MRRLDATTCGSCGHTWPRRARYCGRCGALLVAPDVPARTAVPDRRRSPGRWLGGALALVLLGLSFTSLPLGRSSSVPAAPHPEVALPDAGEVAAQPAPGPEPATPTATDTSVPLCEPEGCEVWRRTLDQPVNGLTLWAGRLVYVQEATVVGLDPATGVIRWRRGLDPVVAEAGGASDGTGSLLPLVAAGEVGVAVATTRGVELLAEGGRSRWAVSLPLDGMPVELRVADDVVLVVHQQAAPASRSDTGREDGDASAVRSTMRLRLTALDGTDGTVRWERDLDAEAIALPEPGAPADVVVVRDRDRLVAVELATGRTRFELPAPGRDAWPQLVGRYLLAGGGPEEHLQVVATRDGTLLAELPGSPQHAATVDGRLIVIVGSAPGGSSSSYEAVALDPDGAVSWARPLPVASGCCACCPSLLDLGTGRVRIVADPRRPAVVVAAATGEELWRDPLRLDVAGADVSEQWQLGDGLLATMPHDGDGGYTLADGTGQRMDLRSGTWPLVGPTIGLGADGMVLLASPTELAAVRFP
jgi:outer membrane protein assembly factor BamB